MSKEIANEEKESPDPKKGSTCGICRSMGIPVCKGHGGGSGGGGGGSDSEQQQANSQASEAMLVNAPTPKPKNEALSDLLEQNQLWAQTDDFIFHYKNPSALLSMTLNLANNTLVCQGHDDLTQEEQLALDTLFKAIEQELNLFKQNSPATRPIQANMSRIENRMTINIPDQKQFDAFIQRLVDKNLLVIADKNLLLAQPGSEQKATKTSEIEDPKSEQSASNWTAPTPFNLTPKPKGYDSNN